MVQGSEGQRKVLAAIPMRLHSLLTTVPPQPRELARRKPGRKEAASHLPLAGPGTGATAGLTGYPSTRPSARDPQPGPTGAQLRSGPPSHSQSQSIWQLSSTPFSAGHPSSLATGMDSSDSDLLGPSRLQIQFILPLFLLLSTIGNCLLW